MCRADPITIILLCTWSVFAGYQDEVCRAIRAKHSHGTGLQHERRVRAHSSTSNERVQLESPRGLPAGTYSCKYAPLFVAKYHTTRIFLVDTIPPSFHSVHPAGARVMVVSWLVQLAGAGMDSSPRGTYCFGGLILHWSSCSLCAITQLAVSGGYSTVFHGNVIDFPNMLCTCTALASTFSGFFWC